MLGPSPVDISLLEIGDRIKVVSDDGSFEAIIEGADADGISLTMVKGNLPYIIALEDLPEYDLYPRGDTIAAVQSRKSAGDDDWKIRSAKEKKELLRNCSTAQVTEVDENTIKFFELFDQLRNTSLGDQHKAELLMDAMEELAEGKVDLIEALSWVIQERVNNIKEASMV